MDSSPLAYCEYVWNTRPSTCRKPLDVELVPLLGELLLLGQQRGAGVQALPLGGDPGQGHGEILTSWAGGAVPCQFGYVQGEAARQHSSVTSPVAVLDLGELERGAGDARATPRGAVIAPPASPSP